MARISIDFQVLVQRVVYLHGQSFRVGLFWEIQFYPSWAGLSFRFLPLGIVSCRASGCPCDLHTDSLFFFPANRCTYEYLK